MNTTIDFKTAKIIDSMSQQISHMDNAVTDFFNKMSDVLERQLGDDEVYAAVIAPEIELTITPLANVRSYLPCFDETDSCYSISEDVPLALCYDPRQVITLTGKRYLSGAVVFVRYPDYRKAREEMQELVKAQKNIELFFAEEKDTQEKQQTR